VPPFDTFYKKEDVGPMVYDIKFVLFPHDQRVEVVEDNFEKHKSNA
jgi:hypothetical protein